MVLVAYILKIREIRREKILSQKELALKIELSQNYLSEIENNKYDIKLSLLYRISQALEVCPFELVEFINEE